MCRTRRYHGHLAPAITWKCSARLDRCGGNGVSWDARRWRTSCDPGSSATKERPAPGDRWLRRFSTRQRSEVVKAGSPYDHLRRTGARSVRVMMNWWTVAPRGAKEPAGFRPRDPGDRWYDWATIDRQVRQAASRESLRSSTFRPRRFGRKRTRHEG